MRPVWSKNRWIYVGSVSACGWAWQGGASFRILPPHRGSSFQETQANMPRLSFHICGVVKSRCYGGHLGTTMAGNWPTKPSESPATYLRTQKGCHKENESTRSSPWMREKSRGNKTNTVLYAQQYPALTSSWQRNKYCRHPGARKWRFSSPAGDPSGSNYT